MSVYTIKGCIKYKDGSVAKGLTVKAFDSDSTEPKLLGWESVTNDEGCYRIDYSTESGAKKPNLLVKVFEGKIFKTSKTKQNADETEIIDFDLGDEPPIGDGSFTVKGNAKTHNGAPAKGITVVAYDSGTEGFKLLGETVTDDYGYYSIEYKADQLANLAGKSHDLVIQAKKEGKVIIGARKKNEGNVEVNLTLPDPDAFIVRGTVYNKDRSYAKGITVTAHDFDPKSSKLLGETITDDYGYYSIEYKVDQLVNPKRRSPYLIVEAKRDREAVSAERPNAAQIEIIDLVFIDWIVS